jgi:hypothetical protein
MWYQKFYSSNICVGIWIFEIQTKSFVYYKGHFFVITLYVDNMLFYSNNKDVSRDLKSQHSKNIGMKHLGAIEYIVGMEINRDRLNLKIWLRKSNYVNSIL